MRSRPRFIFITLMIVTVILVGGLYIDQNHRTIASVQPSTDISLGVTKSQELVIRIYYDSQDQLNAVAGQLDIWEVHQLPGIGSNPGFAVAAVYPSQQDWLISQGYRVEIDQEKTAQLQSPTAALDPRYYYFDNYFNNPNGLYMVDFMKSISDTYPTITELIDIGDAWLATQGQYHRDMWVLRITNEDPKYGDIAAKPPFFMFANIHAREVSTPEMAIRYIKYLTSGYNGAGGYGVDPDVTWLVNHHVVYVLVSQNPDGRVMNEQDINNYWRKNVDNLNGCTDPSSWGTDLNRNSSFKWGCCGGSSGNACAETYRGPSRASEPETAAFQTFAATIFQDSNGNNGDDQIVPSPDNAPGIFITLHSYADDILWPWGFAPGSAPNNAQLQTIGRKLADITGVMVPTGGIGYLVDGSSDDWVYGKLGVAAFTFEIGPNGGSCGGFFPAYGCQDGIDGMPRNFWAEMGPSFIYANKIAGTPFITAYGPDTKSLLVNPASVPAGQPVNLSGTVLDQRYASDPLVPVAAAEYFIDAPGVDGTGIAMSPSDGDWGQTTENVQAVVDTTGLTEGQHYILVHGMNNNGVWGPFTAIFLSITTPTYGVMLTPESASAQADPGMTISYPMQVKNLGLSDDTYDISVTGQWVYTAPLNTGLVAPGDTAAFDVHVTIPITATNGESDSATVMVTSQSSPGVFDTSTITTTANYYALSLLPPTLEGSANPGEQVVYTLHLTNQGNITDTFDLTSSSVWVVSIPASAGPLEPGASKDITATVNIPLDALPGDSEVATITATSQGNSLKTESSTLTTSVKATYSFQAVPLVDTLTAHGRGTVVEYTILITNTGNITDSYNIHVAPGGWPVDAPLEIGPIGSGESKSVTVKVHVPFDIAMGDSNEATLTFISQGNLIGHLVHLYTNTFWYSNFIPLSQKQ
jgi:carboxypeptidase T